MRGHFPGPGGKWPVGSGSQGTQSTGSGPPGGKWQISTEGGSEPLWARNGRELFYRIGDKVMAVDITTQPSFQAGTPRLLFEGRYESRSTETNFDVSPDGQRFLMIKPSDPAGRDQAAMQIHVVLNWFEELKRRVPAGR